MSSRERIKCARCAYTTMRVITYASDRQWLCSACDPDDALEGPQEATGGAGVLDMRGNALPDGFHEIHPRAAYATRDRPTWVSDDVQWNVILSELRATHEGRRMLAIVYWYYRVGMSEREIAAELRVTKASVKDTLRRARERYGALGAK